MLKTFKNVARILLAAAVGLVFGGCKGMPAKDALALSKDGSTTYQLVTPAVATGVDRYAASELALYLKQITGADFPVVAPDAMDADKPSIYIGLSAPALKRLGKDPLAKLKDQEHVARSIGPDIFLYGKGVHGNLSAVMEFLENSLGWRWFSLFEQPILPKTPTVILQPFERKRGFSFRYCSLEMQRSRDYAYQMGANLYFDQGLRRSPLPRSERAFVSAFHEVEHGAGNHHTSFSFIPPQPGNRFAAYFDWQKKKDYFATNPDFFSMNALGQREPAQLCFGNPGLRAELTRQVLKLIEVEGDDIMVAVCALDSPGSFCHCPACKALEQKYRSPGGPLYDYLFELCGLLLEKHPGVRVFTIAYRRSQTQIPPALPAGQMLPPNLVIDFAPIEDNHFADWTHPDPRMQETYRHLQDWAAITREGNLKAFFYGAYGDGGSCLPFGDVDRLITQMRLMHAAGVRGVHLDEANIHNRGLFYELHAYLFFKLRQDINADTDAIIREFSDYMYGPAAALIRTYLAELEAERKAMIAKGLPRGVGFHSTLEPDSFPYLTPANIHRWQGYFDRMITLTGDGPRHCRTNVQLARRQLDLATLWKWFDLQAKYPEAYRDHQAVVARLTAANDNRPPPAPDWEQSRASRPDGFAGISRSWHPLGSALMNDLATIIKAGGQVKPLPPELADLPPASVKRFVPSNRFSVTAQGYPPVGDRIVPDPDAAFGFAATTYLPEQQPRQKLPFTFGFRPAPSAPSVTRAVPLEEIQPGVYRLYKLGAVTMAPDAEIWMPDWSCSTLLNIGQRLHEPGADNCWEVYVSLKFDGPTYGGDAENDLAWCDQVILVRKSTDQFNKP